jgi:RNA polymerase sigma factor (sigma-70 family)
VDIQEAVEIYKRTNSDDDLRVLVDLMNAYTYQEVLKRDDQLEAKSDLNYMIYHTITKYEPSKNYKFITFFWHCYHNHIVKQYRANQTYKRGLGVKKLSMNRKINDDGEEFERYITSRCDDVEKRMFQVDFDNVLSRIKDKKDAKIIKFLYEGYAQKEIAVMMNMSRNAVNQRVNNINQKAYGLELYTMMMDYIS